MTHMMTSSVAAPTSASASALDTRRVADRRKLHFTSIDEALADIDRLVAAEREGKLQRLGHWTLGQALGHLATWAQFAFDGTPLKPPLIVLWIMRLRKNKFLRDPMPGGVKIPKVPGGTLGTEPLTLDEGLHRCRACLQRLDREAPSKPNVIFGTLTHDQWKQLNLRHAELHLSFFKPSSPQS